jgi:hypothetical protein
MEVLQQIVISRARDLLCLTRYSSHPVLGLPKLSLPMGELYNVHWEREAFGHCKAIVQSAKVFSDGILVEQVVF